jgi:hypothetical protein
VVLTTGSLKEEVNTARNYLEYFLKLFEGRWRKPLPLIENVASSITSQNPISYKFHMPQFLQDVLLKDFSKPGSL